MFYQVTGWLVFRTSVWLVDIVDTLAHSFRVSGLLDQVLANYGPQAESHTLPVFINEVYWNTGRSIFVLFMTFFALWWSWVLSTETLTCEAKNNLPSGPLQKKFSSLGLEQWLMFYKLWFASYCPALPQRQWVGDPGGPRIFEVFKTYLRCFWLSSNHTYIKRHHPAH